MAADGGRSGMQIQYYSGFQGLPRPFADLFDEVERIDFFAGRDWFDLLARHAGDDRDEFGVYTATDADGAPLLAMPAVRRVRAGRLFGGLSLATTAHLENFTVACILFGAGLDGDGGDGGDGGGGEARLAVLSEFFRRLRWDGGGGGRFDSIRLSPFAVDSHYGVLVYRALRAAGFWIQVYTNSFNRYENTEGMSHDDYLARFTSKERYNIRSRLRALEKDGGLSIEVIDGERGLDAAVAAYEQVSAQSWKEPHTMTAGWTLDLIRRAARHGILRLGVLRLDGAPVAVQVWIVTGGVGHSVRIAHDEAFRRRHVGTVLTNHMIGVVLDRDRVHELSYGYGNEDFKGMWMRESRFFCGYAAFNGRTRRGAVMGAVQILGRPAKALAKRLLGRGGEDDGNG
ncbi:MAG: GNAT family N-acetyltransferase [Hyphomicrobiales bacterium]|nr:GNAT family N-acetyltransferase [Hyphomicrobiales bacterium]